MLRLTDKDPGPSRLPPRAWTLLAVIAAVIALVLGGALGRWVAAGLVLAVAPRLLAPLAQLPAIAERREALARWLPLVVVAALTALLLGDLALGRPPASRDHGIHYFQTKVLVDDLIPRGELIGWSDRLNSGYPYGDSYPILGYLITGAANLLSFGLISLRTSYAWGLLAIWVGGLAAVAWLASLIAKELRGEQDSGADATAPDLIDPRWAGAFAAIAWLIDPGASREGGWNYLMFHGVWPQLLSSVLWVASLPATWVALRRPSLRSLAIAALLLGGSVLAHPFGMLTVAVSAVAWPIVLWATGALRWLPGGQIRWWLLVHVAAGLVCAGWLVTFLASADSMSRSPVPYEPLGALAAKLVMGELFRDYRAWVGPLAVVGLIVAVRRGRALAWLGVGLVCALLILASQASITVIRLDLVVSAFKNLQFPRYALALKPILYAFTGIGAALLLGWLRATPDRDRPATATSKPRPPGARLLASLALAPLLVAVLDDPSRLLPRPVGGVEVLEGSVHAAVDQALRETLAAEAEALAGAEPRPLTVAFLRRGMGGGTYPLFAITDADARLVLDGHIPAVNYKYQVRRRTPEALALLGVTHVIHDHPLTQSQDDRRLASALEPVGEFGIWTLARLPRPTETHVAEGKLVEVEVEHVSATEVAVHARGRGHVELPIGPYRKWWATGVDGQAIPVHGATLVGGIPGMRVAVSGDGTVGLRYRAPQRERAAMWISLIATGLMLAGLFSGRERQLAVRLDSPRTLRISWALGLVTVAVVLIGGYRRQQHKLAETWRAVLVDHARSDRLGRGRDLEFRSDLVDRGAWSVARSSRDGCDGTLGKDAMAGCTEADTGPRVSMAFRAPYLYRCLRVEVPARGELALTFDVRSDEDVAGFVLREGHAWDGLELRLPGAAEFYTPTHARSREHVHSKAEDRDGGPATFTLRNGKDRAQPLCFAAAAASPTQP